MVRLPQEAGASQRRSPRLKGGVRAGGAHGAGPNAAASASAPVPTESRRYHVSGVVQGVGFRPFIHRLAIRHGLAGSVRNESGEVFIEVEGRGEALDRFGAEIRLEAPPLARIDKLAESGHQGAKRLATYWVGQGVGLMNEPLSTRAVVQNFMEDFVDAWENMKGVMEE